MTFKVLYDPNHECDLPSPRNYAEGTRIQCECGKKYVLQIVRNISIDYNEDHIPRWTEYDDNA